MVQSRQPATYRLMAWEAQDDMEAADRDCREWKLSAIDSHDRHTWRSVVRSVMCAASQLHVFGGGGWGGVTDADVAPVPAH